MSARHQRKTFASPIRTQFTHSKAPNSHVSKTSAQNFRISYWHSYPEHSLHTARRQTRMSARHQRKTFASPIGTATPDTVYTQQGAKPARQQDINTKFSHLLLSQLPRTQFTHSKLPNSHAKKPSTQNFYSSYWHSYPERRLHSASCQNSMAGRQPHKTFASPIGTATPNTVYTQGTKPACQQDINAKFSYLLLPAATRRSATLSRSSKYCACHTPGPAGQRRPALSRGSEYCACRADKSRRPAATRREYCVWPGAPQPRNHDMHVYGRV